MPPPEAPAPTLPDELLEEIFLRLPPGEPAWLVRASLACKLWLGLLTGPAFRGRYHDFHGAPPMLGFFHISWSDSSPPFLPTAKFVPSVEDWREDYHAWDCRHGRVLLRSKYMPPFLLVAWDPMTGRRQRELRALGDYDSFVAAVVCNVAGCNHRACHDGPSSVVFLGLENGDDASVVYAHVSSPEVGGEWSKPCFALELAAKDAYIVDKPPIFIQVALYFLITYGFDDDDDANANEILVLKYDLGSHCLTMIDVPPLETGPAGDAILMAMEDGGLGLAHLDGLTLYLWSRQMGSHGVPAWTQPRVMDLKNLLPIQNLKKSAGLLGSVEGRDIIFVSTDLGIYEISLKSLEWKKIWKKDTFLTLIPYMSFYKQRERPRVVAERPTLCDATN